MLLQTTLDVHRLLETLSANFFIQSPKVMFKIVSCWCPMLYLRISWHCIGCCLLGLQCVCEQDSHFFQPPSDDAMPRKSYYQCQPSRALLGSTTNRSKTTGGEKELATKGGAPRGDLSATRLFSNKKPPGGTTKTKTCCGGTKNTAAGRRKARKGNERKKNSERQERERERAWT